MKATGIVRNIDDLGRIVIPMEIRNNLGIKVKDPMEIFVDNGNIILKLHAIACAFCGNPEDVKHFKNKCLCDSCIEEIKGLA